MSFQPIWWVIVAGLVLTGVTVALVRADRGAPPREARVAHRWVRLAICLLVVLIGVHPVIGRTSPPKPAPAGADVVVLIDRTTSMGAEDYDGNQPRIAGVASDVAQLVSDHPGARFAVIAMDNDARVEVPFTTDGQAVASYAAAIGWRENPRGTGSDISVGVDQARQLLEASRAERPGAQRLFVYCGDGEQTIDQPPRSFASLAGDLDDALVLGYGTSAGAPMQTYPGSGDYVSYQGSRAVSHLDEATLQAIAAQTGGHYDHRTAPGPLPATELAAGASAAPTEPGRTVEVYWVFALVLAGLLGVETWSGVGRYRRVRAQLADRTPTPHAGRGERA
ncbi:VWA domain-containing protein [Propionibacterium freudenreichii]|uniref:vWA domain-containing protein n=1 Tax=Propionibacterium freudenreichii TaxID=1744 RepID=UPI0022B8E2B2|nr:vWA domain-containing protein [Propionibacterium freudenreichii]WBF62349.1 VWA domain-containing protein [Propionibacterium freudenreichii]